MEVYLQNNSDTDDQFNENNLNHTDLNNNPKQEDKIFNQQFNTLLDSNDKLKSKNNTQPDIDEDEEEIYNLNDINDKDNLKIDIPKEQPKFNQNNLNDVNEQTKDTTFPKLFSNQTDVNHKDNCEINVNQITQNLSEFNTNPKHNDNNLINNNNSLNDYKPTDNNLIKGIENESKIP